VTERRQMLGASGEARVARWYSTRGYRVVDRNWRCRTGEIDLVLERPGELVFCEVKTRSSHRFGAPVEAVTTRKARRIRQLATRWLAQHPGGGRRLRFDVAGVVGPDIEVIQGAF